MADDDKYRLIVFKDHTEADFRKIWHDVYCTNRISTFDGVEVSFYDNQFNHAFYESTKRNQRGKRKKSKDLLSPRRCARINWIKDVLEDPEAELYKGYDSKSHSYANDRRVALVKKDYVVVIQLYKENKAKFITAYVADNSVGKIKQSPSWKPREIKKDAD